MNLPLIQHLKTSCELYMDEENRNLNENKGTAEEEEFRDAVWTRLSANIVLSSSASTIPQRRYSQGAPIPQDEIPQWITFSLGTNDFFPAAFALDERCNLLRNADEIVFPDFNYTLQLRVEWPGYDGLEAQIRIKDYRGRPQGITRAKLLKEIVKKLGRFMEKMSNVPILPDPKFQEYRVGPGGIEMQNICIVSLEQVSQGSWQPHLLRIN